MKFIYRKTFKVLLAALFTTAFGVANAQDGGRENTLGGSDVIIITDYAFRPSEAMKIEVTPAPEGVKQEVPEISYATPASQVAMQPFKSTLRAPGIGRPPIDLLYHNYFRFGVGNYADINGEFYFNTLRNRKGAFSAQTKYHSGKGPVSPSQFSHFNLGMFGKYIFGSTVFSGKMDFNRHGVRYYGQPDFYFENDTIGSIRQNFNDFSIEGGIDNSLSENKFRYKLGTAFYTFSDRFGASEQNISLRGQMIEAVGDGKATGNVQYSYMPYNGNNRSILRFDVLYSLKHDAIRATLGFRTAYERDSADDQFHMYPALEAETDLMDEQLTVFAALRGNLQQNTYRSLAYENFFIKSGAEVRNTNEKLELTAGVKGRLAGRASYLAAINYKNLQNMYFFMNDSTDARHFIPFYDFGNNTLTRLHAEFAYAVSEQFTASTWVNLNNYGVSDVPHPYHRPAFEMALTGKYRLMDNEDNSERFSAYADILTFGSRYGGSLVKDTANNITTKVSRKLPGVFDLNLGLEYRFNNIPGLSAFIEGRNLLGNRYELWNYYPVRGLQIRGGIVLVFLPSGKSRR